MHKLSRRDARRIAVRAQLLDARRPEDLFDVVRRLTLLQNDQTSYVAPNAGLVVWSRLGSSFDAAELTDALEQWDLVEHRGLIRTREYMALLRAEMAEWPGREPLRDWQEYQRDWVRSNEACRLDLIERLRADGPLTMRDLPDTCNVPWTSSGWNNNRNVDRLLEFMIQRGEVAVVGRDGRSRLFDLASRVYPDDTVPVFDEAQLARDELRVRALGIARARGPECPDEPQDVGSAGEPAVIEGVRGTWQVSPEQLGQGFEGRAALLSPLDRLVYDRKRMTELFEFDYQLEMYKPVAKRRWGYFALPILYGDRLVGKLDAFADRKAGVFRVDAIHQDADFSMTMTAAVHHEIDDLARWLHLDLVMP